METSGVEERWGSTGHFGASVSPHNVAPTHAHLQAIKNRRKELIKEEKKNTDGENDRIEKDNVAVVSTAISSLNKFSSDGSFMDKVINQKKDNVGETKSVEFAPEKTNNDAGTANSAISANQLAAKALQVRMKGKHEDVEKLLKKVENIKEVQDVGNESSGMRIDGDHKQHESSTRSVDDNVRDEIRNFKKCLIKMFAEQEMDVVFLETVMWLARQKRHCLVECVPLPRDVAKQAPVYFKKAIDEAEDDWSQHDAKKLIDTNGKGLRGSVPQNFPYFHVEFGLNKGFAHVIDNEEVFHSSFGLNVISGMLGLPAEDMHRRGRHLSVETQRQALDRFSRNWVHFDWTKQLD